MTERSDIHKSSIFNSQFRLPGNKLIQLGKHLIDLNPILQILRRTDVGTFVDHHPAHVSGSVFAARAISGFGSAAAMHGGKIGCPADKFD